MTDIVHPQTSSSGSVPSREQSIVGEATLGSRFNQVLANVEAERANIAPAAEAERSRLRQGVASNNDTSQGSPSNSSDDEDQGGVSIPEELKTPMHRRHRPTLMRLPSEVRLKILYLAIDRVKRHVKPPSESRGHRHPVTCPPVTRTGNCRLEAESLMVLTKKSNIIIHSTKARKFLGDWLSILDLSIIGESDEDSGGSLYQNGFDAVTALTFKEFKNEDEYMPQYSSPMFVAQGTNIETVEIRLAKSSLVNCVETDDGDLTCLPNRVAAIVDKYGFRALLFLTKLAELKISIDNEDIVEKKVGSAKLANIPESLYESGEHLKEWLEAQFTTRGRAVNVIIPEKDILEVNFGGGSTYERVLSTTSSINSLQDA